jgi:hypothetical protein
MEAASTSKTPENFYQIIWPNNPEDSHLYTHHCENLKSHYLNIGESVETAQMIMLRTV